LKNEVIKSQQYEKAAELRDNERKLQEQLKIAKKKWEDESKK
jgi:ATP-dependent Clp protease ATP-binding subunit ClpC